MEDDTQSTINDINEEDKNQKNYLRNEPKHILKVFTETYPALWQIKNKEIYTNRNLKNRSYSELINIWKQYNSAEKTVKAKIQSLRGSVRFRK